MLSVITYLRQLVRGAVAWRAAAIRFAGGYNMIGENTVTGGYNLIGGDMIAGGYNMMGGDTVTVHAISIQSRFNLAAISMQSRCNLAASSLLNTCMRQ